MYIPLSLKFFFVREVEAQIFKMDGEGGWGGCGDMVCFVGFFLKLTIFIDQDRSDCCAITI